ncbi:low-density lipoprotein receptor-related protein 4-like, partial [Plakobranchus ocellatus]
MQVLVVSGACTCLVHLGKVVMGGDVEECNGLTADWVSRHIYWTDAGRLTLEIANFDGSGRRVLVGSGLLNPRGVLVDPTYGYIFWADQGTKKIERSGLDGTDRKVLVDEHLAWPNQLALSHQIKRLLWVDARKQKIMSCDLEGNDVTEEHDLVQASGGNAVFGLVVIGNTAIVSSWINARISSVFVSTGESMWRTEMVIPGSRELYSLVSTAASIQKPEFHPCGQPDKGRCTHLCLPINLTNFNCACPTFGGLALSFNAKSCEAPSELLFFTLRDSGEVGFISIRGAQSSYLTLAGRSSQPSAVTYDPIKQVVYWSDVHDGAIYFSSLAGKGEKHVFLNGSDGVGTVNGLALDWVSRELYFTNEGQSSPGLDGAVYSWHRLERIALDRSWRKIVSSDLDRPRGIALDLIQGYLFYVDSPEKEAKKVYQSLLDGSESKVILDKGLSDPNGLSFYDGRLYVADSTRKNTSYSAHLMVYDTSMEEWTPLKLSTNVSLPRGLAVQGDTLYYSDWVSTEPVPGYIKSFNLRFGVDNNFILSGMRPTGLHYSPLAERKQDSILEMCKLSPCSDLCVRMPGPSISCGCPDQTSKVLFSDMATCSQPQNFLLVADLNTIKMISLDEGFESAAHTLYFGDVHTNIVALAYDSMTATVYWNDIPKQSIFSSQLAPFKPTLVYKANHYIEALVVDSEKKRLFWTGNPRNGSGVIVRFFPAKGRGSYHELVKGLYNPRALLLYPRR